MNQVKQDSQLNLLKEWTFPALVVILQIGLRIGETILINC